MKNKMMYGDKEMYPPGNVAKRGERKQKRKMERMEGKGYAKGGMVKVKGKNC